MQHVRKALARRHGINPTVILFLIGLALLFLGIFFSLSSLLALGALISGTYLLVWIVWIWTGLDS